MKVKCKVCSGWFERENIYCDHCAAKYGTDRSKYDINLLETPQSYTDKNQNSIDKIHTHKEAHTAIPNLDTLKDLKMPFEGRQKTTSQERKKSPRGIFRSILLFMVFINVITGILGSIEFSDFGDLFNEFLSGDDVVVVTREDFTEKIGKSEFPMNSPRDFTGDFTSIENTPEGIYEGTLSTASYINYDTKNMRFDLKDDNYSGQYQTPIYITIASGSENTAYFFDIWDQNTLKMLGTYVLDTTAFNEGIFIGNPEGKLYDDPNMDDLKGQYKDDLLQGRLALPYTIESDINYFDFEAHKINDDPTILSHYSFWENEFTEDFISEDSNLSITFYTHETPQGYPHSSMYYDGVFAISDGDTTYPSMPFYLSEDGELYALMDYMDTPNLTIRDLDFEEYLYYDEVDTQLYRYFPIHSAKSIYTLEFKGQVYRDDNDQTRVDGSFYVTNRSDGLNDVSKEFSTVYIDAN